MTEAIGGTKGTEGAEGTAATGTAATGRSSPPPSPRPSPRSSGRPPPAEQRQRRHILDRALELMSRHGSVGTSMRQLADACGLNVATIYHYFPSKADLLQALIEQQRYGARLAAQAPPLDPALPARERLAALLRWLWTETADEHTVLRLVMGEGVRGDATARRAARRLIVALDARLADWMASGFPELAERGIDPAVAARLVRRHLLALVAETLVAGPAPNGEGETTGAAASDVGAAAAVEMATALFG